jgi:hypothetical protein
MLIRISDPANPGEKACFPLEVKFNRPSKPGKAIFAAVYSIE